MTLSMAAVGVVSGGPRWTPAALGSSLAAWFDASVSSSVTDVSGKASQWNDLSTNALHLTQATDANRPTIVTDGLEFTASPLRWMDSSLTSSSRNRCVAAVLKSTSTALQVLTGTVTSNSGWQLDLTPGTNVRLGSTGVSTIATHTASLVSSGSTAIVLGWTDATTWRISVNGTASTGSNSTTFTSGRTTRVGAFRNGAEFPLIGTLHELVFTDSISTENQDRLEGYLAHKWGLTGNLPAGHAYKNIRP